VQLQSLLPVPVEAAWIPYPQEYLRTQPFARTGKLRREGGGCQSATHATTWRTPPGDPLPRASTQTTTSWNGRESESDELHSRHTDPLALPEQRHVEAHEPKSAHRPAGAHGAQRSASVPPVGIQDERASDSEHMRGDAKRSQERSDQRAVHDGEAVA
jgi:hypothetical protein